MALRDLPRRFVQVAQQWGDSLSGSRKRGYKPTEEIGIADTRLAILNTVSLFPFNPDLLTRTKGGLYFVHENVTGWHTTNYPYPVSHNVT